MENGVLTEHNNQNGGDYIFKIVKKKLVYTWIKGES